VAGRDQARLGGGPGEEPRRRAGGSGLCEDRPVGIVEVDRRFVLYELLVTRPVGGDRAEVTPVAVKAVLAHLAGVDQARQQLVSEVLQPIVAGLLGELVERVQQRVGGAALKPVRSSLPSRGCSKSRPPDVRSRSHGRPLPRWSLSDTGLNCWGPRRR
jgi:hypothetical protein